MILMVAVIAMGLWVGWGYAQEPPTFTTYTITNSGGTDGYGDTGEMTESFWGKDYWLSKPVNFSPGGAVSPGFEWEVKYDPGWTVTDGAINGDESWHLVLDGDVGGFDVTVEHWFTNNGAEIEGSKTSKTGTVNAQNGDLDISLEQSFWNGQKTITDQHFKLTNIGAAWQLTNFKAGFDADNIYVYNPTGYYPPKTEDGGGNVGYVPEPATVVSMLLGGAGLVAKRIIKRRRV
jgi:hypothetical protein